MATATEYQPHGYSAEHNPEQYSAGQSASGAAGITANGAAANGISAKWPDVRAVEAIGDEDFDPDTEYLKCHADAGYFCDTYGVIDDAQELGEGTGQMRFRLWPDQKRIMWQLMVARLIILLKARQLGMSWVVCAYALWLCLFHPGKLVLVFSKGKLEADVMLQRILKLYRRLPGWLRTKLPPLLKDNTSELEWNNGSKVQSLPASQNAGSSFTASLVILDEFAKMVFAESLYTAVKPTVDAGGQLIILSSFKWATGRPFLTLWDNARKGLNNFVPVFLPWWSRPGRTVEWREQVFRDSTNPQDTLAEYPASEEDSFAAGGNVRFPLAWIQAQHKNIRTPLINGATEPHLIPAPLSEITEAAFLAGLSIYRLPEPGRSYVIGSDPSEGLPQSDFSPALVIDAVTWEEVCLLYGKFAPEDLARYLCTLSEFYGDAAINVLRKNHGHAVLAKIEPQREVTLINGLDGRPGWDENVKTNPLMIDGLAECLKDDLIQVHSQIALTEMQMFQDLGSGKCGAPPGMHDDLVKCWMAAMIAARQPRRVGNAMVVTGNIGDLPGASLILPRSNIGHHLPNHSMPGGGHHSAAGLLQRSRILRPGLRR